MSATAQRVTYLVGTSYCGSTLLSIFMDSHPQVVSVGEASFSRKVQARDSRDYPCSCGQPIVNCDFWNSIFRRVRSQGFEISSLQWSNDYRYRNRVGQRVMHLVTQHPRGWMLDGALRVLLPPYRRRTERIDQVNVAFIGALVEATGSHVLFDASKGILRLKRLLDVQALDVSVVWLVRDVRAFASSAKRRRRLVPEAALHWKRFHQAVADLETQLPPDRFLRMRYEDLCENPQDWQRRLYRFMGVQDLTPPDHVRPCDHHVIGNRIRLHDSLHIRLDDSWRNSLTRSEEGAVLGLAGAMNEAFGYTF